MRGICRRKEARGRAGAEGEGQGSNLDETAAFFVRDLHMSAYISHQRLNHVEPGEQLQAAVCAVEGRAKGWPQGAHGARLGTRWALGGHWVGTGWAPGLRKAVMARR